MMASANETRAHAPKAPSSERVSIQEAAARLPELLERVRQGHEIIIAEDDRPMARLTALAAAQPPRSFGGYEGKIHVTEDFDDELPEAFWLGEAPR
jgi:prevent-host-death family protein